MIRISLKLSFFFIFLASCITVNYNPTVPEKKQEKVLEKKSSNINNSKPKMSASKRKKIIELGEKAGETLGICLVKLMRTGIITKSESDEFIKKVSRGLKVKNMLLFATATKDDNFCVKMVPYFIDKDSYELDDALNKYWKSRGKRG